MTTQWVVRVKYYEKNKLTGVGYLINGRCTSALFDAQVFPSEAAAWDHLLVSGELGYDKDGPWAWVEELKP